MDEPLAPEQHDTLDGVPAPQETIRLVGHADAVAALLAAYRGGRLPSAIMLAGPRGVGKATLAFQVARYLLAHPRHAEAPGLLAEPDPGSALFRQVASGAHPSVLHLTRPFDDKRKVFKTVITVDEIRRLGRFLSLTSHDGAYRVVIVDSADDMNVQAANALLKTLEEPPSRTVFLLVAHAPGNLLPTIRSRCQVQRLGPLSPEDLRQALSATGAMPDLSDAAFAALAQRAGGSVREALLLTQFGGLEIAEAMERIVFADHGDVAAMHRLADAVSAKGQGIPFDIFNRHALDLLSGAASKAALIHDAPMADQLARQWQEARTAIEEAVDYNLDRRQHALGMLFRLREAPMRG